MTLSGTGIARFGLAGWHAALLLLTIALFAGATAAQDATLGDAPRREESQDRSGWIHPVIPKALKSRAEVVQLYQTVFVPGNNVTLAWTGSLAGCAPGTTNVEHQQAVIDRVNYHRALVGLPPVTRAPGLPTARAQQAAALMMSAHNALSHTPPTTWTCHSTDGAAGASSSNLTLGAMGVASIVGYMDDRPDQHDGRPSTLDPVSTARGHVHRRRSRREHAAAPGECLACVRSNGNRADANHRYMTLRSLRDEMVARGWLAEGDGPDLVVMCVPQ